MIFGTSPKSPNFCELCFSHPVKHVYVLLFFKKVQKSRIWVSRWIWVWNCEIFDFQRGQKHNTHDERKELLWFNGYFHAWRAIKLYYKAPFTSHLRLRRTISHTICQSSFRTKWFSEQPSTHLLRLSKISLCSAILFVLLFRGCVNFENNFSLKKSSWCPSNFYEK